MSNLRAALIRLAYVKPEMRSDLLPLLKTAEDDLFELMRPNREPAPGEQKEMAAKFTGSTLEDFAIRLVRGERLSDMHTFGREDGENTLEIFDRRSLNRLKEFGKIDRKTPETVTMVGLHTPDGYMIASAFITTFGGSKINIPLPGRAGESSADVQKLVAKAIQKLADRYKG